MRCYKNVSSEELASTYHRWYEILAPNFGYKTRNETAVPWNKLPENNKELMLAAATHVIEALNLCKIGE